MHIPVSTKSCWTCKDRKIACDKGVPTCKNCQKSKRQCLGYGLRLSWPRRDDRKRALVLKNAGNRTGALWRSPVLGTDFVNVFGSDVYMFYHLRDAAVPFVPSPQQNPDWRPFRLDTHQVDLFTYYRHIVAPLLTSANNPSIQNLVFRMSFSEISLASVAVLHAIYALASQHLSDLEQALYHKSRALSAIRASIAQDQSSKSLLQCIVAALCLLLCETIATPYIPQDWTTFFCVAQTAFPIVYSTDQSYKGDLALILDWMYYFNVHSRFSIRHFSRRRDDMLRCASDKLVHNVELNSLYNAQQITPTLGCSREVMMAISGVIHVVQEAELDVDNTYTAYTDKLDKLERRLKFAQQDLGPSDTDPQASRIAELYVLAARIYVHRVGRQAPTTNPILQGLVDDAFSILESLDTCERTFPLFIVSCEARTDLRKMTIFRILNATQAKFAAANVLRVRSFIERFWAQQDLDVEQEIDHATQMTAALSANGLLPIFA